MVGRAKDRPVCELLRAKPKGIPPLAHTPLWLASANVSSAALQRQRASDFLAASSTSAILGSRWISVAISAAVRPLSPRRVWAKGWVYRLVL